MPTDPVVSLEDCYVIINKFKRGFKQIHTYPIQLIYRLRSCSRRALCHSIAKYLVRHLDKQELTNTHDIPLFDTDSNLLVNGFNMFSTQWGSTTSDHPERTRVVFFDQWILAQMHRFSHQS